MNADLHCHSTVSDGTLSPSDLAQRAAERGVSLWALTDHDEVSGQAEAAQAARACGMAYLSGVEVSVSFAGTTVHIVGLGVDPDNAALRDGLRQTRGGREQRARDMAAELAKVGIANAYEGALQYVGNPELISRAHFARHLVSIGKAKDMPDVFKRYLAEGKPGFVPHRWASLRDALNWIHGAQGVAVVAHPARYGFTPTEEYALFTEFKAHGGRGVEVVTGSHSQAEFATYADIAREFDLLASRGSDFHGPEDSRIDLGGLPDLPSGLTPVWEALQARIQPATV
jgi:predicted metal-dependent phosphoesterase TrpH